MSPRAERLGFLAWLLSCTLFAYWFAWVAISALLHSQADSGGNVVFNSTSAGSTVYPFTYVGAGVGFVIVLMCVYKAERTRRDSIVTAPLVAYLTSVGIINIYEKFFLAFQTISTHSTYYWRVDFGSTDAALFSIFGITWVFASAPWWDRRNLKLAGVLVAMFAVSMLTWLAIGFPPVQGGSPEVYLLNTVSRIASQLVPAALVLPSRARDAIYYFLERCRNLLPKFRLGNRSPAAMLSRR